MYINKIKVALQAWMWSTIIMFVFPVTMGCFGAAIDGGDPDVIPMLLIWGTLFLALLGWGGHVIHDLLRLVALNNCLKSDTDGSVTAEEAAGYLRMTREKFNRLISYAEKKKILINLVYDAAGDRFVLTDRFNGVKMTDQKPFVGISCPGCGANLKIRAGSTAECVYCDRQVTAPDISYTAR